MVPPELVLRIANRGPGTWGLGTSETYIRTVCFARKNREEEKKRKERKKTEASDLEETRSLWKTGGDKASCRRP